MADIKRQTAFIFWIKDIAGAVPEISPEGFRIFSIKSRKARRVNVVAAVVDSYSNDNKNYSSITLDDGSAQIRVKAWDEDVKRLSGAMPGDILLVIGVLHESGGEIFIRPEIAKRLSPEWALSRKEYLISAYGIPSSEGMLKVSEEAVSEEPVEPTMESRGKVVSLVASADEGVAVEELIQKSGMPRQLVEVVLEELIKEGEVFRPRAGIVQAI